MTVMGIVVIVVVIQIFAVSLESLRMWEAKAEGGINALSKIVVGVVRLMTVIVTTDTLTGVMCEWWTNLKEVVSADVKLDEIQKNCFPKKWVFVHEQGIMWNTVINWKISDRWHWCIDSLIS